jgi:DUF2075 family protein/molybdopterin biosynthesis enzyme MoaB
MIVYQATRQKFNDDVFTNNIDNIILKFFEKKLNRSTSKSEIESWKNSLSYMDRVLNDNSIPSDCGIIIEYQIPMASKRIDFIITGRDNNHRDSAILVELKQWQEAELTEKDGVVITRFRGGLTETSHPSYQAWSYASLLTNFNQTVQTEDIQLKPCAYLHNYSSDNVIKNPFYQEYIDKAPVFLKDDAVKFRDFIKTFMKHGDKNNLMLRIDSGDIKASKALADSLSSMMQGNKEFVMIDDQKIVYEQAVALAKQSNGKNKNVLIVEGGPGTGKSVVAINLLVALTGKEMLSMYISKNAAPRAVYERMLTGTMKKSTISNLFKGSGSFIDVKPNTFDALVVDEAHRLNEKSGLYSNLGENQVKELINASQFTVFFVDEDQKIHLKDVGSKEEIEKWANQLGANIHYNELSSQFRCGGSDGYLAWLDNILQIRETANESIEDLNYDFKIYDNPNELRAEIEKLNQINNKSRMVAGYCWKWESKKDPSAYDVIIPEFGFQMRWNLTTDGSLWIIAPESVNEIGCIHTCQGLEVDYIGVIIGDDLDIVNGQLVGVPQARATSDMSVRGWKKLLKEQPDKINTLDKIIKNTYRTLMTRGMKGCFVYFTNKKVEQYFKDNIL